VRGGTLRQFKLHVNKLKKQKEGAGNLAAMTGMQHCNAAYDGDAAKVRTLLSTHAAQSFIKPRTGRAWGHTALLRAKGHAAVTKKLLAARGNGIKHI
jgi:hypothetical protein